MTVKETESSGKPSDLSDTRSGSGGKPSESGDRTSLPYTVMAKPVGGLCNLNCGYCYYKTDATRSASLMPDEILERFIKQYVESSEGPEVSFVWHGGEPALAGLPFYKRVLELQKRYLPEGWTCQNNLQTNGVLLDERWCAFLAESGFDVGLSIDGAPWLHDHYRKDHSGKGSWKAASSAIETLKKYGVKPDLLCTVNAMTASEPLETYRALRSFDTGWIQFIPIARRVSGSAVSEDSVSPEAYGAFLNAIFDEWARNDLGRLDVQLFAETARTRAGGEPGLCWMARTCGRALIVERDGAVYSCDHFVKPEYRLGDISTTTLSDLAGSTEQIRFGDNKLATLPNDCVSCPWLSSCNGGCPKDRFMPSGDGGPPKNYLCPGLKSFFAHSAPTIDFIISRSEQARTPRSIMDELRKQSELMWKGVSRNDPCPCGSGKKAKNCCWDRRPR